MFGKRKSSCKRLYIWITVPLILVFTVSALAGCGGGGSPSGYSPSVDKPSGGPGASNSGSGGSSYGGLPTRWNEYESAEYDFVFMYPSDWELVEERIARTFIVAVAPRGGGAVFLVAVGREDPYLLEYTDDEFLYYMLEDMGEPFSSATVRNLEIGRYEDYYFEQVWLSADLLTTQGDFWFELDATNEDGYLYISYSLALEDYEMIIDLIWDSYDYYYY
jgi:hypothetical protein